jgi:hypothetical protein
MRVIKYFYEEPTFLHLGGESSEELDPAVPASLLKEQSHYRGYLAASDLDSGAIGGSSLEDDAAAHALTAILDSPAWYFSIESGQTTSGIQLLEDEVDIVRALVKMPSKSLSNSFFKSMCAPILSISFYKIRHNTEFHERAFFWKKFEGLVETQRSRSRSPACSALWIPKFILQS